MQCLGLAGELKLHSDSTTGFCGSNYHNYLISDKTGPSMQFQMFPFEMPCLVLSGKLKLQGTTTTGFYDSN